MKITAAVVPVRSAPFEIETLDLAEPIAEEVLVRVVASGMCHTDLHARDGYFANSATARMDAFLKRVLADAAHLPGAEASAVVGISSSRASGRFREGFRMPARDGAVAPVQGAVVRKPPKKEPAGRW